MQFKIYLKCPLYQYVCMFKNNFILFAVTGMNKTGTPKRVNQNRKDEEAVLNHTQRNGPSPVGLWKPWMPLIKIMRIAQRLKRNTLIIGSKFSLSILTQEDIGVSSAITRLLFSLNIWIIYKLRSICRLVERDWF